MFTGDSLSVLLFLAGTGIAAMMGAIAAPNSQASRILWSMAAVFGVLTVIWLVAPAASPIVKRLTPIVTTIATSGVWVMLGTVFIVSQMVRAERLPAAQNTDSKLLPRPPRFAADRTETTRWSADISLVEAGLYIGKESRWGKGRNGLQVEHLINEMKAALEEGRLHAWGKAHPEDEDRHQISRWLWGNSFITLDKNYAFFAPLGETAHEIMLSKGEVDAAYPRPMGEA